MRANPTEAEKQLWAMLRDRRLSKFKFRRQQIIAPYIVDFVCLEHRLIIEADGSQHADNKDDARRTAYLNAQDFKVMRFWNNQIRAERDAVASAIFAVFSTLHPADRFAAGCPSPARGEGIGAVNG